MIIARLYLRVNNRTVSVVTNGDVTTAKLYYTMKDSTNSEYLPVDIPLSQAVIYGLEGIKLSFATEGYAWIKISQIHGTTNIIDYMPEIKSALADIESDPDDADAVRKYLDAVRYMNEYDRVAVERLAYVTVAIDNFLVNAVVNAQLGSAAQVSAIEEYRAFHNSLSADEKETEEHKANVARVNAVIVIPQTSAINAVKSIESSASNYSNVVINENSKFADSTKYPYTTFSYSNGNTESATFTLNPINFSAYEEVYFGIAHAMTYSEGGSMTIAGQTFNITKLGGYTYRMKATVKNGVLTVTDDGSQSADMVVEPYFIQVTLSENVLNGSESLVIEFATGDSYSWLEVTNMIATKMAQQISTSKIENQPSATGCKQNGVTPNDKIGKLDPFVSSYSQSYWTLFRKEENNNYDGVVSFAKVNYNDYEEVYFGMYLLLDAESWDPLVHQTAVITINGQSWTITSNPQEHWYKVKVSNGVLTVVTDKDGNLGQKVLEVELSASVLNGTEALSISFNFSAYAEMQTTEMQTSNFVDFIV